MLKDYKEKMITVHLRVNLRESFQVIQGCEKLSKSGNHSNLPAFGLGALLTIYDEMREGQLAGCYLSWRVHQLG